MSGFVADGAKRYAEANLAELEAAFEQEAVEIEARYALISKGNLFVRCVRRMVINREIAQARRSIFGKDNLYLMSK